MRSIRSIITNIRLPLLILAITIALPARADWGPGPPAAAVFGMFALGIVGGFLVSWGIAAIVKVLTELFLKTKRKHSLFAALFMCLFLGAYLYLVEEENLLYEVELNYGYETKVQVHNGLFLLSLVLGYIVGYWITPKRKITDAQKAVQAFLEKHVFTGLTNVNYGFDSKTIHYFSESDFAIVLERVEKLGIGIYGIEPWLDGSYYNTSGYEDYTNDPTDPAWYKKAFQEFVAEGKNLQYAASYYIPSIEKS